MTLQGGVRYIQVLFEEAGGGGGGEEGAGGAVEGGGGAERLWVLECMVSTTLPPALPPAQSVSGQALVLQCLDIFVAQNDAQTTTRNLPRQQLQAALARPVRLVFQPRSWSHFVGIHCQNLINLLKIDF